MSIDLIGYFRKKPNLIGMKAEGSGWIINLDGPYKTETEDLPQILRPYLKSYKWQVQICLEGEFVEPSFAALENLQRNLMYNFGCRIYDPQTNVLNSKDGKLEIIAVAETADNDLTINLNICFENADRITPALMSELLDIIENEFPKALPHRYGTFEPLQERWDKGGKSRYLEQWNRQDIPFSSCKTPARDMFMTCDYFLIGRLGEFRCGKMQFEFRQKILTSPNDLSSVFKMAEKLSLALNAFYCGFTAGEDFLTPFWKGLPSLPHMLLILGPPLLNVWPEFESLSKPLGHRHRIASISGNKSKILPPKKLCLSREKTVYTPKELATGLHLGSANEYAQIFPFPKHDPYRENLSG